MEPHEIGIPPTPRGRVAERGLRGMLVRRLLWVPSLRGLLLLFLVLCLGLMVFVRGIHPFLAIHRPHNRGVLIVEGWLSDEDSEQVAELYQRGQYVALLTTGGPIHALSRRAAHGTYAQLSANQLAKLGITPEEIFVIPAPQADRDRTLAAARALGIWWAAEGAGWAYADLVTAGPHARRSWILYRSVLDEQVDLGVVGLQGRSYDAAQWWKTSAGFRTVFAEVIAYAYVKVTGY
ncbi:MAG: ElyC/SanA/YdcF family protein [Nannocystaceae bacterium]